MRSDEERLKKAGKGTRAVHSGTTSSHNSLNTPIFQSSTFFLDEDSYRMWQEGKPRAPVYSRYHNPTTRAVEKKIAQLEEAEDALVFQQVWQQYALHFLRFLVKEIE